MEVMVIDDDSMILNLIKKILEEEGFGCHIINSCEKGLELLKVFPIDLVLLDLDLDTNMSGFILINTLRKAKVKVPIVVISGTTEIQEKIKALDMGADDYLVKPFDKKELVARVKRHILRSSNYYNNKFIVGDIEMDTETQVVTVNNKGMINEVKLTKKEYDLLALLMSKPGITISKNTILKNLYRDKCEEPDMKITDVLVCKIRKELRKYTSKDYIHTVWSRGYSIKDVSNSNIIPKTNMMAAAEIEKISNKNEYDNKKSQFQAFIESQKINKLKSTGLPVSHRRLDNFDDEENWNFDEEEIIEKKIVTTNFAKRNPSKI